MSSSVLKKAIIQIQHQKQVNVNLATPGYVINVNECGNIKFSESENKKIR